MCSHNNRIVSVFLDSTLHVLAQPVVQSSLCTGHTPPCYEILSESLNIYLMNFLIFNVYHLTAKLTFTNVTAAISLVEIYAVCRKTLVTVRACLATIFLFHVQLLFKLSHLFRNDY
jgi:energy-converting hydrogenase Eha subunit E